MTALTGKKPKDSYKDLLQVSNANGGIDTSLRTVEDGEGTPSALEISTTQVSVGGAELVLDSDGDTSITADTDDRIDLKIGGADRVSMTATALDIKIAGASDFQFRENVLDVLSGSTLAVKSGATFEIESGATFTVPESLGFTRLTGEIVPYAGSTEPAGWLYCAGQDVSRTTYAALFAVIGITYGTGDGSTTFTLPDLRGRVVAGRDNMVGNANRLTSSGSGINGDSLGAGGGTETHTLTEAQMPSHSHSDGSLAASLSGATTNTAGSHTHALSPDGGIGGSGSNFEMSSSSTNGSPGTNSAGSHSHTVSGTITITGSTATAGSGDDHQNAQPTLVLNYLIKT